MKRKLSQTEEIEETESPPSKKQKIDTKDIRYPSIPIDGNDLLSALIYPLSKNEFMKDYWTKKYYNVSIDNQDRVKDLLNGPFPFHLKTLLQETASQKIHVWMKNKINKEEKNKSDLLSFSVEDFDSALSCFHCGGNLYFRSSQELADVFITSIMNDLDIGIGANYNDGNQRGEIEVFVSHKNHLTNWHNDFQHNFTVQLFGHKRWYLLPIDENNCSFNNVYRGNTPHYSNNNDIDLDAKECQYKLHKSQSYKFDINKWKEFDTDKYKNKIKIIDLKPGSTLYFPSGMWHKVETISDKSLSINLSLVPMTYSHLINNAINHFMSIQPNFRTPILYNNINQTHKIVDNLCNKLKNFISNIKKHPSCLIPYSFSNYSLSSNNTIIIEQFNFDDNKLCQNTAKPPKITSNLKFIINPLSIIIPFQDIYPNKSNKTIEQELGDKFCTFEDLEQYDDSDHESDDEANDESNHNQEILKQYILNINFGENDTFTSLSRIIIKCQAEVTIKMIDWIRSLRKRQINNDIIEFTAKEAINICKSKQTQILKLLRVLIFFGYLSIQN